MQFVTLQEIKDQNVRLWSQDGQALAIIPREVLKDVAGVPGDVDLDNQKLILLATANIEPLGRAASRKHEAGDVMPASPGDFPCVMILAEDIVAAGEKLSSSMATAAPHSWGTTFTLK